MANFSALLWLLLLVLPFSFPQEVNVSIRVGNTMHTFPVTASDTSETILLRAQLWCSELMAINEPSCPKAIVNRAVDSRAQMNEARVESLARTLQSSSIVESHTLDHLEELAGFLSNSKSSVAANAYYLWSLALRRYKPMDDKLPEHGEEGQLTKARRALGRALLLSPPEDPMKAWNQDYSSFLQSIECVVADDVSEDDSRVHFRTFQELVHSVERSYEDKSHPVEMLLQTVQRLKSQSHSEHCIDAMADVCLQAAFRIIGRADPSACENETRRLRFLALRVQHSIHPIESASGLARLVEEQGNISRITSTLELLWTAYTCLRPAYASTHDSEVAVGCFVKYTHQARVAASSIFFEIENSTTLTLVSELMQELPLVPHWRLGFSGPCGRDLVTGLSDWSTTLRFICARSEMSADFTNLIQPGVNTERPRHRLVVGFVSSWFCNSAIGRFMLGLIRELDRQRFEVHIFHVVSISGRLNRDDTLSLDFDAAADYTHIIDLRVGGDSDQKSALSRLANLQLDAAVFCDIGMDPATYFLAFNRFSKVQIVFWGHPFTSGIRDSIDYYILPFGAEEPIPGDSAGLTDSPERYVEQLVRFETLGIYFDRIGNITDMAPWDDSFANRDSTLLSMARTGTIRLLDGDSIDESFPLLEARIYACLQHCGKFHPLLDDPLLSILDRDKEAVLLIRDCGHSNSGDPSFQTRLNRNQSYAARIIVLRENIALGALMRLLGAAHVALEPFPFPASITTLDALAVGTPVVSHGGVLVSRGMAQLSASLYRRMGMEGCCVARNIDKYVDLAVKLAHNVNGARDEVVELLKMRRSLIFEDKEAVQEWGDFLVKTIGASQYDNVLDKPKPEFDGPQSNSYMAMLTKLLHKDEPESRSALNGVINLFRQIFLCEDNFSTRTELAPELQQVQATTCRTLQALASAVEDKYESLDIAALLQEVAGVCLWGYQISNSVYSHQHHAIERASDSTDYILSIGSMLDRCTPLPGHGVFDAVTSSCLAVASAAASTAALTLDSTLIDAAAFGASAMANLGLWDGAATYYDTLAQLKRPFFWGALLGGSRSSLTGGAVTASNSSHFLWDVAAVMNPLEASRRGFDGGFRHPSSDLDLGDDNNEMSPFRTIQFGGYNSAQVRHLSSQLIHLVDTKKVLPKEFLEVASDLSVVADSLDIQRGGARWEPELQGLLSIESTHVALIGSELKNESRILAVLGRTIYVRPTPALRSGALHSKFTANAWGNGSQAPEVEDEFLAESVAIVDDLLSKEALFELRSFCEDSTIFHKNYIQGYVGAFMGDGFGAAGLLHQVATELIAAFPRILLGRRLVQAWSYKYDEGHDRGIDPHSDAGAVSVNLWLTPDDANLDAGTGGLIIWPEEPPKDWTFEKANSDTASVLEHLESGRFEDQPTSMDQWRLHKNNAGGLHRKGHKKKVLRVPYKENRCILFESRLFHQTDKIKFKSGYRNRRINVTFLFL